jgi:hypothetical protein
MPNMKGLRGELTRAIQRELAELTLINLHDESHRNGVPVLWMLDRLHTAPAKTLTVGALSVSVGELEALENVGTMEMVLRKGYTREQFIGIGAGYFMPSEPNQRTKHKRLKTLKELLHGQRSPTPTYAPLIKPAMKNYGTRRRPYMDLKNEGPVEAPELSATREQLNPLLENGFYLVYTDIQHYRAALERWLRQIAPRLYTYKDTK